jgi:hypothetical protein
MKRFMQGDRDFFCKISKTQNWRGRKNFYLASFAVQHAFFERRATAAAQKKASPQ